MRCNSTQKSTVESFKSLEEAALLSLIKENPQCITYVDNFGVSPIMIASSRHQALLVAKLIELGAHVSARDWIGNTALVWALQQYKSQATLDRRVFELLVAGGADLNDDFEDSITPLMMACTCEPLDAIEWLVQLGADIGKVASEDEMTVLQYACLEGLPGAAACLLDLGAPWVEDTCEWLKEEIVLDPNVSEEKKKNRIACLALLDAYQLKIETPNATSIRSLPRL